MHESTASLSFEYADENPMNGIAKLALYLCSLLSSLANGCTSRGRPRIPSAADFAVLAVGWNDAEWEAPFGRFSCEMLIVMSRSHF